MEALRFISIFIGIIVKGCMESPLIMTILITLSSIAALIFIPYWVGLLALLVIGPFFPPPAWAGGLICMILIALAVMLIGGVFCLIYEAVKTSISRRRWNRSDS